MKNLFVFFLLSTLCACTPKAQVADISLVSAFENLSKKTIRDYQIILADKAEDEIKRMNDLNYIVIGSNSYVSNTENIELEKEYAIEIGADYIILTITPSTEVESSKYKHDATFLVYSRELAIKRQTEENARPKLISEYKAKGYRFSDTMNWEEAKADHFDRVKERFILTTAYSSRTNEDTEELLRRYKENIEKLWEDYKNKMEPDDMFSFLFIWTPSKIKDGIGTGWDGYVIIRGDYFLHSLTMTVYN